MLAIMLAGSMLALAFKPQGRELLMQFYVLGFMILIGALGIFSFQDFSETSPGAIPTFAVALTVILSAYPYWREVLSFERRLPLSLPILALTVAGRWAEDAAVMVALVVAGLLAATRRPGWVALGTLLGIASVYLGAAALTVPDQPGSLGTLGGILSLGAGAAYLGISYRESELIAPQPAAG